MTVTSTLSSYLAIARNLAKWQTVTRKSPDIASQIEYFVAHIHKIKSADELIRNPRLFNFAMSAFGLGDMTYAKGLMGKVLQQGVVSDKALANRLGNSNIRAFAKAFDFAAHGADTTSSASLKDDVVARFVEQSLESSQGKQNPGVELALYFRRNAPNLTSVFGILADKNILKVVQTALDIPPVTSKQPIDTQARMLSSKIHLADFKDPKKLESFIARFAALYDSNNAANSGASTNPLLSDPSAPAMGVDLLLKLQKLKR